MCCHFSSIVLFCDTARKCPHPQALECLFAQPEALQFPGNRLGVGNRPRVGSTVLSTKYRILRLRGSELYTILASVGSFSLNAGSVLSRPRV